MILSLKRKLIEVTFELKLKSKVMNTYHTNTPISDAANFFSQREHLNETNRLTGTKNMLGSKNKNRRDEYLADKKIRK
jgi:hypothetical protein